MAASHRGVVIGRERTASPAMSMPAGAAPSAAGAPADWSPSSWRALPIKQQPSYPDAVALEAALEEVRRLPPLVSSTEVDLLRAQLAEVAEGRRFLLQGGDCAERFVDCAAEPIEQKLRILLQMSLVLTWGARVPTLRIARLAGQFAKPRSKEMEPAPGGGGGEVFAFRGDNVNSFDLSARTPDPSRLVAGYFHSAATLNYARALLNTGARAAKEQGAEQPRARPSEDNSPRLSPHPVQALPTCTRQAAGTWALCRMRPAGRLTWRL